MTELDDFMTRPETASLVDPTGHLPAEAGVLISELENHNLKDEDISRLQLMIPKASLDIHEEIALQYQIVKSIQSRILDSNSKLNENASAKELSTIISGFNSYLNLYLRSMEKIDRDKQLQEIEVAVLESIADMPEDVQKIYFSKLEHRLNL